MPSENRHGIFFVGAAAMMKKHGRHHYFEQINLGGPNMNKINVQSLLDLISVEFQSK